MRENLQQPEASNEQEAITACGGKISDPARYPSALYRGKRVFFCHRACLPVFEADPDRFMVGEIEHPTNED
jgi:YHS domain-containing protein